MQKSPEKAYWFRARRRGRGWGLPCSVPGWAFFLASFAVLIFLIVPLLPQHPFEFILALALWGAIYVLACYAKGEPMPARSGDGR
jgi:hypothetical protein